MKRYRSLAMFMSLIIGFAPEGVAQRPREFPGAPVSFQTTSKESVTQAIDSLIQRIINQTNLDTLIRTVNILSGEDSVTINDSTYLFLSRHAGHPHNDLAADFIYQTLSRYGLTTFNQQYSATGSNVYAIKTGTDHPDKKYLVCAHYDAMPGRPPAPGADDNASGTAAVLEAARILGKIPTPYTIIFHEISGGLLSPRIISCHS